MLKVDRIRAIEQYIARNTSATVAQLSEMFNVSDETVRHDIADIVARDPMVIKVHGGICRIAMDSDPPYSFRSCSKRSEKEYISKLCASYIKSGDYVFLDSSTTTQVFAQEIAKLGINLTVVTNSLSVANELCDVKGIELILAGGRYTSETNSFIGKSTVAQLSGIVAEKAFISVAGLDLVYGATHNNENESEIRRVMIDNSQCCYLMVDSSKFGRCKAHKVADISEFDAIITEATPSMEWLSLLDSKGVKLHISKD